MDKEGECSSEEYDFNHPERGKAVIINNIKFEERTEQEPRRGAAKDSDNLKDTFRLLGFDVELHTNLKTTEMLSVLQQAAREDHSKRDCFICAISSHGYEDEQIQQKKSQWSSKTIKMERSDLICGTDGVLPLYLITDMFTEKNCPTLIKKPKLFFIQACRGDMLAENVEVTDGLMEDEVDLGAHHIFMEDEIDWGGHYIFAQNIPIYRDYFLAYSTPPGFLSFRRGNKGSWFVISLCDVLKTGYKDTDLQAMLTKVNHQVAYEFSANSPRDRLMHGRHIVPWTASMLTKELFFRPKTDEGKLIKFV